LRGALTAYVDFSNILTLSSVNDADNKDSQIWFYVNIILTVIALVLLVYFINYMRKKSAKKRRSGSGSFNKPNSNLFGGRSKGLFGSGRLR